MIDVTRDVRPGTLFLAAKPDRVSWLRQNLTNIARALQPTQLQAPATAGAAVADFITIPARFSNASNPALSTALL